MAYKNNSLPVLQKLQVFRFYCRFHTKHGWTYVVCNANCAKNNIKFFIFNNIAWQRKIIGAILREENLRTNIFPARIFCCSFIASCGEKWKPIQFEVVRGWKQFFGGRLFSPTREKHVVCIHRLLGAFWKKIVGALTRKFSNLLFCLKKINGTAFYRKIVFSSSIRRVT